MACRKKSLKPWRRSLQALVLLLLALIPLAGSRAVSWSPSRLAQGQLPAPQVGSFSGDTWVLQFGDFSLSHPLALLESLFAAKILLLPFLMSALLPLLISVVLGRVFCSWLCPVGFFLEILQKIMRKTSLPAVSRAGQQADWRLPFFVLLLALSALLSMPLLASFDPPHLFGRELMYLYSLGAVSMSGLGLLLGIILLDLLFASRIWCRSICPSGGGLSLLGNWRKLHIELDAKICTRCGECNSVCPYYLQPMGLADGVLFNDFTCDNCSLCRDICPEGAIGFRFSGRKRCR